MFSAEVKQIYSLTVPNLENHVPEDGSDFIVPVRIMVGPKHGIGEEFFDLDVCGVQWVEKRCEKDGFLVGRHSP